MRETDHMQQQDAKANAVTTTVVTATSSFMWAQG
jgi:hypothetical protein